VQHIALSKKRKEKSLTREIKGFQGETVSILGESGSKMNTSYSKNTLKNAETKDERNLSQH